MITTTIASGKILMQDHKLLTIDEAAITARARQLAPAGLVALCRSQSLATKSRRYRLILSNQALPPTIAILGGTGKEGPGLALRWAYAGYPVIIGSRQAEKAQATAAELNAALGSTAVRGLENGDAARLADICVLTVVQAAHQAALESLQD